MKLTAEIISGFVGSVLAKRFEGATASPQFHHELWGYACSDHQFVAVAAPRGHAKSTAGTIAYGLAELLFRNSRFLVIVSDTEAQAQMFVEAMKSELSENEDLVELFGIKKDDKGKVVFPKDTATDVIVECSDGYTFRIIGKGAEQKMRGLNWNGTRPDLIIIDDLENDELVMNKDRREKLRRWVSGALLPAKSPKGKIRMWGTILHMDSQLNRYMPQDGGKFVLDDGIKVYEEWPDKRVRGWLAVKYRAHNPNMDSILWPDRFPKKHWITTREAYSNEGILDVYSQEYLNNPIDESVAYFKRGDLTPMSEEERTDIRNNRKPLKYYCSIDLAIAETEKADYSAFVIAGVDENRHMFITNIIRERIDAREIVDTILALHKAYQFEAIGIEEMMISKSIGPFLREEMLNQNIFPQIVKMKHRGKDKIQRARSMQGRLRAKTVKFDKQADWYPALESEMIRFPRDKHDDQVDALAYLGLLLDEVIEAPTVSQLEEEEYIDELRTTGYLEVGRSRICGY